MQIPESLQGTGGNITDLDVIETICYGVGLDNPLVERFEDSQSPDSVSSVFTYFGSWNGVMRIFPGANYGAECGDYDPRVRPWLVGLCAWSYVPFSKQGHFAGQLTAVAHNSGICWGCSKGYTALYMFARSRPQTRSV